MKKNIFDLDTLYIPDSHKEYNVLPICRENNMEMIIWDHQLLNKIKRLTNMPDYMIFPNQKYKSYKEFDEDINEWIKKYPNHRKEILEYKDSIKKLNNKDNWAIVQYNGESNWSLTKNNYYYVVMYIENNSWVIEGIIDNEEYNAFWLWDKGCSHPVDLINDLKIIIDPNNNLKNEFIKLMKNI